MPKYRFEIVQTVCGQPDQLAYDIGLAHTPRLNGAAMVVIEEFDNEDRAKSQGEGGEVWQKHCPDAFKDPESVGGLDIFYLGPA